MDTNKPILENIKAVSNHTVQVKEFSLEDINGFNFWHYHRELEIIYINKGSGKRYIGSHISYFKSGELILVGAFLPHYSFIDKVLDGQKKFSIKVQEGFPGVSMLMIPEMLPIKALLERAKRGVSFSGKTKRKVGNRIERLGQLSPLDRFIGVFEIFRDLAMSDEYRVSNSSGYQLEITPQDNERLRTIFNYVRENFKRPISLDEVAVLTSMTPPSFARYFKSNTGKTFTQFVNQYRLVHASKLLSESALSITDICFESGFNNFSHFNKVFKNYTGKSPSVYRKDLKQIVS